MTKYVIAREDEDNWHINLFRKIMGDWVLETRICPTVYPNKKKAKRVMKRLNKYHDGGYFLLEYND